MANFKFVTVQTDLQISEKIFRGSGLLYHQHRRRNDSSPPNITTITDAWSHHPGRRSSRARVRGTGGFPTRPNRMVLSKGTHIR